MGRYSTVQAYADNNANMRSVSYEQATGSSEVKKGAVKAEKVSNPYGSTAGAGSGEFHVYRHARSRELERWKHLDEQEKEERLRQEFEDHVKQACEETAARTEKNRKKRQRQKEAKLRKKNLQLSGVAAAAAALPVGAEDEGEEFTYTPMKKQSATAEEAAVKAEEECKPKAETTKPIIPNDGSFLALMKQQLATAGNSQEEANEAPVDTDAKPNDEDEERPMKRQAT